MSALAHRGHRLVRRELKPIISPSPVTVRATPLTNSDPSSQQTNNGLAQALGQAISAYQSNNFEEAYRLCDLILKQDNGNVVALHLFGILDALRRNFPKALAIFWIVH